MIINEIFYSIQGEGFLAGVPSVFIRIAGCPLRCTWCDTKYAWSPQAGTEYSVGDLTKKVCDFPGSHAVITGGEPMTHPDLPELVTSLKKQNRQITIETSGIEFVHDLACDLISISPKFPDSQNNESVPPSVISTVGRNLNSSESSDAPDWPLNMDALNALITSYNYQLKFVIVDDQDVTRALHLLDQLKNVDRSKVMLMPRAANRQELLERSPLVAQMCLKHNFVFSSRIHIMLWNTQRGV